MASKIHPEDRAWLEASGLVDVAVNLDAVRLSLSGPPAMRVRMQGRSAMTVGSTIWFSKPEKLRDLPLLVHELVHVAQYRERGMLRFLGRYSRDILAAGFKYSSKLELEAPAYARQREAKALLAKQAAETAAVASAVAAPVA